MSRLLYPTKRSKQAGELKAREKKIGCFFGGELPQVSGKVEKKPSENRPTIPRIGSIVEPMCPQREKKILQKRTTRNDLPG